MALAETFIKLGADPEIKNEYGVSAIDLYATYPEIIELLKNKN